MTHSVVAQLGDHRYPRRLLAMILVGACGALLLTWFMHELIHSSHHQLDESGRAHMIEFVRIRREESSIRKDRKPERPAPAEAPPTPAPPKAEDLADTTLSVSITPPAGFNVDMDIDGLGFGSSDGEYLPIVKVAPVYPQKAAIQGLEGVCVVRYTVTATGSTRDIEVIREFCSDSVFHRPSIAAARKFKYKPRIVDSEAIEVHNVKNRFIYELRDE